MAEGRAGGYGGGLRRERRQDRFPVGYLSLIHIFIEGSAYSGLMGENYISAYTIVDALALILIPLGLYPVLSSVFQLLKNSCEKQQGICQENHTSLEKVSFGSIIAFAAILFLAWIPYLLTYWPGFIFGDSLASLRQASG